ncbi:MAG: copper ion binding protein [Eubacteriales bacterium]
MEKTIKVEGMSCQHCVRRVENALKEIDGITEVKVILEDNKAVIETTAQIEDKALVDAISDAGYTVTSIE